MRTAPTITTEMTAADLLALSPDEREAAYRALRDLLASDFARLDASQRNHQTYVCRSREAGHVERADVTERQREQVWSEYERLAHLKALLARLTGRSTGYTSRDAWRDECCMIDEALAAGV